MMNNTACLFSAVQLGNPACDLASPKIHKLGMLVERYRIVAIYWHQVASWLRNGNFETNRSVFDIPNANRARLELISGILAFRMCLLARADQNLVTTSKCRGGYLHGLKRKQLGIINAGWIRDSFVNGKQFNRIEWMPKPTCAQKPVIALINSQSRMEKVPGLSSRRSSQSLSGLCIINFEATVILRAMDQDFAPVGQCCEANGVFVDVRMIIAAINLSNDSCVFQQQPFSSKSFVNENESSTGRHDCSIKSKRIEDSARDGPAVQLDSFAATDPVNQSVATPNE